MCRKNVTSNLSLNFALLYYISYISFLWIIDLYCFYARYMFVINVRICLHEICCEIISQSIEKHIFYCIFYRKLVKIQQRQVIVNCVFVEFEMRITNLIEILNIKQKNAFKCLN